MSMVSTPHPPSLPPQVLRDGPPARRLRSRGETERGGSKVSSHVCFSKNQSLYNYSLCVSCLPICSSILSFLHVWLESYPADFLSPPSHPLHSHLHMLTQHSEDLARIAETVTRGVASNGSHSNTNEGVIYIMCCSQCCSVA